MNCVSSSDRAIAAPPSVPVSGILAADYAAEKSVCVRPLVRDVTDRVTGALERVVLWD